MSETVLQLDRISQAYGEHRVVKQLSLRLDKGRIGCLLGESGCGKTTVLRTVAGFERLQEGEIRLAGRSVSRPGATLAPARRKIGMVFQDYALFPHLTLAENVAFGLSALEGRERMQRVAEMLELVGLEHSAGRYPHEISGGQQQRVALARALAPQPKLLLMDEPFSNLDVTLRERLSMEVRQILKKNGTTALFVTHNQHEAFAVADEIGVMHDGTMLQWDDAPTLYRRPADRRVARFVGEGSLIGGRVDEKGRVESNVGTFPEASLPPGTNVEMLIRPEAVLADAESPLQAQVTQRTFRGATALFSLRLDSGEELLALWPSGQDHAPGEQVSIRIEMQKPVCFPL